MPEISIRIKGSDSDMLKVILNIVTRLYIEHFGADGIVEIAKICKDANMEMEELKIDGKAI